MWNRDERREVVRKEVEERQKRIEHARAVRARYGNGAKRPRLLEQKHVIRALTTQGGLVFHFFLVLQLYSLPVSVCLAKFRCCPVARTPKISRYTNVYRHKHTEQFSRI